MKKSRFTLYRVVVIGLMAAMVFVCTMFLGIRIPTPTGTTQLKTANAICLLTGLLFGGWTGGRAGGVGAGRLLGSFAAAPPPLTPCPNERPVKRFCQQYITAHAKNREEPAQNITPPAVFQPGRRTPQPDCAASS